MSTPKRTPLAETHETLGAKMVDFAGFWMPVAYGSIIEEHTAVRERVGLFDVSHMGEFLVTGDGASTFVNDVITNDCSKLGPGGVQYTAMCRENGTVVDDLLVFVLSDREIMLIVNASNIDKDFEHIAAAKKPGIELRNVSDDFALLAVQGPASRNVMKKCSIFQPVLKELDETPYYKGFRFDSGGSDVFVTRTGYTGELGFEIFVTASMVVRVWNEIMEAGAESGISPIGLGARDTLRFEASFCLYGHELDDETSPLEAGLDWVVKLKKERFTGDKVLREEKANGPRRVLRGFELEGRNILRQGYEILGDGEVIGKVTSGTFAPTLRKSLCMALIDSAADDAASYTANLRNRSVPVAKTTLPFYKSRAKQGKQVSTKEQE